MESLVQPSPTQIRTSFIHAISHFSIRVEQNSS